MADSALPFELGASPEDEQTDLRTRWLDLIRRALPEAARDRPDWPIRLDHCFARVILDAVCGRPWRETIAAPAYKHLEGTQLRAAIKLAEAVISGQADLHALNRASLLARGKLNPCRA